MDTIWMGDDAAHIAIANSFAEDKRFFYDFTGDYRAKFTLDELISKYPNIEFPLVTKGPVYFVLLGSIYDVFDVKPEHSYIVASYFSNLLMSIFYVLLFFFVQKKFDLGIALLTVSLAITIPYLAWNNAKVFLYPLLFIFSISALYFLEKKSLHYIIFGIFLGLAHLTHPFGIYLGAGYLFFLLLNKEFKGFLLVGLVWHLMLIPWFIRNFFLFEDIGRGLYLPFSNKFSILLINIIKPENTISLKPRITDSIIPTDGIFYSLSSVFQEMFKLLSGYHQMEIFIIFILIFIGFAFFSVKELKINFRYTIICFLGLLGFYSLILNIENQFLQIFSLYVLPWIFLLFLRKFRPNIIENHVPRLYLFIISLTYITMIGTYFYAITHQRLNPELKQVLFPIVLLIPIAITGLEKLISQIMEISEQKYKHMPKLVLMSLVIIIIISMSGGFQIIFENSTINIRETSEIKEINEHARKIIPSKSNIATNVPYISSLRTDHKSILLPLQSQSIQDFKEFEKFYNVTYIVYYDMDHSYYDTHWWYLCHMDQELINSDNYYLEKIVSVGDSFIIKIRDQQTENYVPKNPNFGIPVSCGRFNP